ncbi:DeoR family transcriptional regulator [Litorimonas taeanensis]|uniref:DeoR family transcriptional regulator n=2 Tax=Litorimonas taeanensis TaxID=568099 RepID=A0A420WE50_9PROT|nr:DeoR family transcriptional regulator [Litorimonas taeanensis]
MAILEMVSERGFVATEAMVTEFDVTPQTIRRDLNELKAHGLLTRFHGGAGQADSVENRPYKDRLKSGVDAKRKIAELTASLVPNGASLFLNIGTTTEFVAQALLGHENLHVVTNNINVAQILAHNSSFKIMIAGGEVRSQDGAIIGSSSVDFVNEFRLDIGIVGIGGIDEAGVLLDFDHQEVKTARTILRNSRKTILVADQHKFGRPAMNRMGHLEDLDMLVTDRALSSNYQTLCENSGVNVFIAS